jgi:regulator of sirC expression with transglutaminase-like and TPR domain
MIGVSAKGGGPRDYTAKHWRGSQPIFVKCLLLCGSLIVLFSHCVSCQNSRNTQTLEETLAGPENSIDIGCACLTLAKEVYPGLRAEAFSKVLDNMTARIVSLNRGQTDPIARIGLLNTYFFRPGWWNDSIVFTYDLDDLEATSKDNRYLNGFLATKKGSCITMSMLYLAVADRLRWPIVPVRAAKHIFCRYVAPGFDENNIEPTCGGGYLTNEQYIQQGAIPEIAIRNGVYLRPLTKKEYLATLLSNHELEMLEMGMTEKARKYLELAISLDTTLSTAYWNLGEWHYQKAKALASTLGPSSTSKNTRPESSMLAGRQNQIRYHLNHWKRLKTMARDLGIVLRLPEGFFTGQAKAIEEFKHTGKY